MRERQLEPDQRARVLETHTRNWGSSLLDAFHLQTVVDPPFPAPATGARLVVANHRSPADIPILVAVFGGQFLSKGDIANWPVIGRAARKAGTIFVERSKGFSGAAAIRAIRKRLEQGSTVIVFPEGTTFAGDEVHAFHRGALSAARGLDVEVVPVGLAYDPGAEFVNESFASHLWRMAARVQTRVAVKVGSGIRPERNEPTADLASLLQHQVQELVNAARSLHSQISRREPEHND